MNDYVNDFNEAVKSYYESLKKCTPISREEEKKLLTLAKQGDISAKNKIIESNLRFVFNIAKKYKGYGVPINELISEGNIGLLKAIEKFDDTKDVKFISYAVWWVKHMIFTFVKTKGYGKSVSTISDESLKSKIENIEIEDEEDEVIYKSEQVKQSSDENEIKDLNKIQDNVISKLLSKLNPRERYVIEKYYGLNGQKEENLEEIGSHLNISNERVRQIKLSCFKTLRTEVMLMPEAAMLFK
jgi:RNA polymerase sigma factor, sigma-70 family